MAWHDGMRKCVRRYDCREVRKDVQANWVRMRMLDALNWNLCRLSTENVHARQTPSVLRYDVGNE